MLKRMTALLESIVISLSFFIGSVLDLPSKVTEEFKEKNGGYIYGICHPNEDFSTLTDAGFNWVRIDIPYPFNSNGTVSASYNAFKDRCRRCKNNGLTVMGITPYPNSYINIGGFNPVDSEAHIKKTQEIAVYLYNDLKDLCGAFQVTNEMGIGAFTYPLTLEQAAVFVGVQLKALAEVTGDFPIGYNTAGLNEEFHKLMKPYYRYCDYVGIDLYCGNTGKGNASDYIKRVKKVYRITHKPVILCEFGFLSEGKPKTEEEKKEILTQYGYASEAEARADIENFVSKLPAAFRARLTENNYPVERWGDAIFRDYSNHFYREIKGRTYDGCDHTPEGQAKFYADLLPKLGKVSCLAGMIIYCCQDGSTCWFCGFEGCPSETRWGLIDENGTPKPAYYTVKDYFTSR